MIKRILNDIDHMLKQSMDDYNKSKQIYIDYECDAFDYAISEYDRGRYESINEVKDLLISYTNDD